MKKTLQLGSGEITMDLNLQKFSKAKYEIMIIDKIIK